MKKILALLIAAGLAICGHANTLQSYPTATTPAGDDWIYLQGATNSVRKLSPLYYAPSASPALTGTPTAPTATVGTNTTQLATTAFVIANAGGGGGTWGSITGTLSNQTDLNTALGLKAPNASPTFTGTPVAPTASIGTNTTQIATTAFVLANAAGGGSVSSVTSANGAATIANPSTTPVITIVSAPKWTTARTLAGNSVDGSANVAFSNALIAQGTADAGLTGAQFLGALATGILKSTTTTGVLSIAVAGDFPTLNQNTTGSAATLTTARTINGTSFNGSANITVTADASTLTNTSLNATVVGSSLTSTGNLVTGSIGTGFVVKGVTMTLGSDASNDIYYRNSSGVLTRLAMGTTGQFLAANTGAAPSWGSPSGSGDVVGPGVAVNNNVAVFNGTTGKLIKDSGVVALVGVTTSAGAGDSGKVPLLNGSGVLDTSFFGTTAIAKGGSGQTTAVLARNALNAGATALTDAATIATDCSTGNVFTVTLGGNRTMGAPTNLVAGATYIWKIKQASGGSDTLAWNAVFKWPGGTAPTMTAAANATDVISGVSDGTSIFSSFIQDVK